MHISKLKVFIIIRRKRKNIMLVLKNIKKNDGCISADYYVGIEQEHGFIKVRIKDGEILKHENPCYGYAHAKRKLMEIALEEDVPEKVTVMWY